MTVSISKALEVKDRVEADLLAIPGVYGVGFGGKLKAGKPTGDFSIRVLVFKKRTRSDLPPEELIPEEIDGVKTDVVEARIPIPYMLEGGIKVTFETPIAGQVSIDEGTLGCFAWRQDTTPPKAVLLSNDHVLYGRNARRQNNDPVILNGCCSNTLIATLTRTVGQSHPLVDAAIADLQASVNWLPRVHGVAIKGTLDLRKEHLIQLPDNDPVKIAATTHTLFVKKYGAVTDLKVGAVADIDCPTITREHQLSVRPVDGDYFSRPGDSGSVIYVDNSQANNAGVVQHIFGTPPVKNPDKAKIVALLWGGDDVEDDTIAKKITVGSHIEPVTSLLNIRIATNPPEVVYQVNGEPRPHPALARFYSELPATHRLKEFITLYGKHSDEVSLLLRHNRRLIVAWNRNHGPKIVRALIAVVKKQAPFLPVEVDGQGWAACVESIAHALLEVGSPDVKKDVKAYLPLAIRLGGRSYEELLGILVVSDQAKTANETERLEGS